MSEGTHWTEITSYSLLHDSKVTTVHSAGRRAKREKLAASKHEEVQNDELLLIFMDFLISCLTVENLHCIT